MNVALIFAGGTGIRMNSRTKPKQFLELHGKTIIMHTIEHFENHEDIDFIVVVCIKDWMNELMHDLKINAIKKVVCVVEGGETAQASIYNGLLCIKKELKKFDLNNNEKTIVLIHDGVRPLIDAKLISANISCVKEYGNAVTVSREFETLTLVDENDNISQVNDREKVRIARAPQSFYFEDILKVHEQAIQDQINGVVDSASIMNQYGYKVHTIIGPTENIKVTTATDFYIFRALLDAKESSQIFG